MGFSEKEISDITIRIQIPKNEPRDTYKHHFKVGNVIVRRGITNDLVARESQHQNSGNLPPVMECDFIGLIVISPK